MSIRCIPIAAMTLALCAGSVEAETDILGNIPLTYTSPTYNTNGQVSTGLGLDYAVEFKATSTETVDSATLVLTIQLGTTPTLGIYNATGGGIGSLVGSFFDSSLDSRNRCHRDVHGHRRLDEWQQLLPGPRRQ